MKQNAKNNLTRFICILICLLILTDCKRPRGCFNYSQSGIRTITFDASCSKRSSFYHWHLFDSISFDTITSTPFFNHKFSKIGIYEVVLVVGDKKDKTKRLGGTPTNHMTITVE